MHTMQLIDLLIVTHYSRFYICIIQLFGPVRPKRSIEPKCLVSIIKLVIYKWIVKNDVQVEYIIEYFETIADWTVLYNL